MYDNRDERNYLSISYDEKNNEIKATLHCYDVVERDGYARDGKIESRGIDEVNSAIRAFAERRSSTLPQLIANKKIRIAKSATDYIMFSYDNSYLMVKGERRYQKNRDYSDNTPYVEPVKPEPVVEQPVASEKKQEPVSEIKKEKSGVKDSVDRLAIIEEISKLNPDVQFAIVKNNIGDYCLSSDTPGDKLILPEGFEYNEKNGITNKHHTKTGSYVTIDVLPLIKEQTIEKINTLPKEPPKVETVVKKEEPVYEETFGNKIKRETTKKINNLRIVNWKKIKRIVIGGLILVGVVSLIDAASRKESKNNENYVDDRSNTDPSITSSDEEMIYADPLPDGVDFYYEDDTYDNEPLYVDQYDGLDRIDPLENMGSSAVKESVYNDSGLDRIEPLENLGSYETYIEPVVNTYEEPLYVDPLPEYDNENVEYKLDDIVTNCFINIGDVYGFLNGASLQEDYNPINFNNYVSGKDQDVINTITNARNYVIGNAYSDRSTPLTTSDVYRFLGDYVNYVFEGSTVFDGKAIKSFDYLEPSSQFIVTVLGESMLQLYPGFEYSTPYSNYTFSDLIDRMSDLHGDVAETLERGRSY